MFREHRTEWQTPHASVLIKTSPSPGSSTGMSLIAHGALAASRTTALHVFGRDGIIAFCRRRLFRLIEKRSGEEMEWKSSS